MSETAVESRDYFFFKISFLELSLALQNIFKIVVSFTPSREWFYFLNDIRKPYFLKIFILTWSIQNTCIFT